jgi:hypothetical protein
VASDSAALAYASLATRELIAFSATKTTSITTDGFTAVGVGVSHSIISQEAADRVASIIANKAAENGLSKLRAPIYSSGVV